MQPLKLHGNFTIFCCNIQKSGFFPALKDVLLTITVLEAQGTNNSPKTQDEG